MLSRTHSDVPARSLFILLHLFESKSTINGVPASLPEILAHYGDTTNILIFYSASSHVMSYFGVLAEDAARVGFTPLLLFGCPYSASQ